VRRNFRQHGAAGKNTCSVTWWRSVWWFRVANSGNGRIVCRPRLWTDVISVWDDMAWLSRQHRAFLRILRKAGDGKLLVPSLLHYHHLFLSPLFCLSACLPFPCLLSGSAGRKGWAWSQACLCCTWHALVCRLMEVSLAFLLCAAWRRICAHGRRAEDREWHAAYLPKHFWKASGQACWGDDIFCNAARGMRLAFLSDAWRAAGGLTIRWQPS